MNITLAIDDELVGRARSVAHREGTTLNALVRAQLQRVVDDEERIAEAKAGMRRLMESSTLQLHDDDDVKEMSRSRDPNLFSGHQHIDHRDRGEAS